MNHASCVATISSPHSRHATLPWWNAGMPSMQAMAPDPGLQSARRRSSRPTSRMQRPGAAFAQPGHLRRGRRRKHNAYTRGAPHERRPTSTCTLAQLSARSTPAWWRWGGRGAAGGSRPGTVLRFPCRHCWRTRYRVHMDPPTRTRGHGTSTGGPGRTGSAPQACAVGVTPASRRRPGPAGRGDAQAGRRPPWNHGARTARR